MYHRRVVTGGGATKVWTTGRKWAGNIMPFLCWLPFAGVGIYAMARDRSVTPFGVELLVAGTVAGWVGISVFGFWGNATMRRQLAARIKDKGERWFVGFATPKFSGVLDAHEDVGFLIFGKDVLLFAGDSLRVEMPKDAIVQVRFRANVHTIVGLGRWVCVEGIVQGKPVRMFIEPRERRTMLGNLRLSGKLRKEIEAWAKG